MERRLGVEKRGLMNIKYLLTNKYILELRKAFAESLVRKPYYSVIGKDIGMSSLRAVETWIWRKVTRLVRKEKKLMGLKKIKSKLKEVTTRSRLQKD